MNSIPTRSGMDSSSMVDTFDRGSSNRNEMSKIHNQLKKELDIGDQNILIGIDQEESYDFNKLE